MRNTKDFITSPRENHNLPSDKSYTIILFSESHGYRMKNYGAVQLTRINGVHLIDSQIKAIKSRFKNFSIVLSCGFESSRIWKHVKSKYSNLDISLIENPLYKTTNSCESVRLAMMNTKSSNVLICASSNIFEKKHLDQINFDKTSILCQKTKDNKSDLKVYKGTDGYVKIDFGVGDLSWSEMIYLNGEKSANDFYSIIDNEDYKNKFVFEAINKLAIRYNIEICENKNSEIIKLDSAVKLKEII
jgi:hypothetical protein